MNDPIADPNIQADDPGIVDENIQVGDQTAVAQEDVPNIGGNTKASADNLPPWMNGAIHELADALDPEKFILIGGAYINYLGRIRATTDVDILIGMHETQGVQKALLLNPRFGKNESGKTEVKNRESLESEGVQVDLLERTNGERGLSLDDLMPHTDIVKSLGSVRVPHPKVGLLVKLQCWLQRLEGNVAKAPQDLQDALYLAGLVKAAGETIPVEGKDWFPQSLQSLIYLKEEVDKAGWDLLIQIGVMNLYDESGNELDELEISADDYVGGDVNKLEEWLLQPKDE